MTLKPPTRTFPKLVMKEWPEKESDILKAEREFAAEFAAMQKPLGEPFQSILHDNLWDMYLRDRPKALSDFTRVVEETGILKDKP